jgi:hypothetical protein
MKTSSLSLFNLIHSLSREEKNYILRRAIRYRKGGKNILIRLFHLVESSSPENYDEKEIAQSIPNLSIRKKELFESILSSLADRESRLLYVVMFGKIRSAAMLHYRKMFPETFALLTEVEQWALQENQPYLRGVILQYKTLFANIGIQRNIQVDFDSLGKEMIENAKSILQGAEIFYQYLEISKISLQSFLLRSPEQIAAIKLLSGSAVNSTDLKIHNLTAQSYFYISQMLIYKVQADFEAAFTAAENCWTLMNRVADFSTRRPQEYLTGYISFVNSCVDVKDWSRCKKIMPAFEKWIEARYPENWFVKGKYFYLRLKYHYYRDTIKMDKTLLEESENLYLRKKELFDSETRRGFEYLLSVAFLDLNDLSKAWDYCQTVINAKTNAPRRELSEADRLIFLLILLESKKYPELRHQCMQLQKFISTKEKQEYLFDYTLTKHLKNIDGRKHAAEKLVGLRNDLLLISKKKDSNTRHFLHLYDFIGWTERKIEAQE